MVTQQVGIEHLNERQSKTKYQTQNNHNSYNVFFFFLHLKKTTKNKALLGQLDYKEEFIHTCAHPHIHKKRKRQMPIPFKIFSFHNMIRAAQMTTKINTSRRKLLFNFPFDCYHNKTKLLSQKLQEQKCNTYFEYHEFISLPNCCFSIINSEKTQRPPH